MKLLLVAAACLALAFGDGHDGMAHGTIVEELTKAGLRKFFLQKRSFAEVFLAKEEFC